jgi:membrane-bound lytic murein transglycosylase C
VTTLLTPSDPRAVDLFTDSPVQLTSEHKPYLLGLVLDHRARAVGTPAEAEAFAEHLLSTAKATREIELEGGRRTAHYVRIPMVANLENKQAQKYRPAVTRFATRYRVSPSLVYAIIKTESNFNPFAVSSARAFGLMQLVPTSGGREAHRRARGVDEPPSWQLLFDAESNIELGTAYLNVLDSTHLEKIANPTAREYCVISAYNTGPSNVFKTFSKNRVAAVNAINGLQPPAVYEKLRAALPFEETRQYLVKVTTARKLFVTRTSETSM